MYGLDTLRRLNNEAAQRPNDTTMRRISDAFSDGEILEIATARGLVLDGRVTAKGAHALSRQVERW